MKNYRFSFIAKCFTSIIAVIIIISATNILIQNYFIQSIYMDTKKEIHIDEILAFKEGVENSIASDLRYSTNLKEFDYNVENALIFIDEKNKIGERKFTDSQSVILLKSKNSNYLNIMSNNINNEKLSKSEFFLYSSDPSLYLSKETAFTSDGIKVHIVTLLTSDEVQPIFRVLNKYYSIQFVITLLILIFFGFVFTKAFKKPISNLKIYAKNIANANFEVNSSKMKKDELGELKESLDQISINLSSKIDFINKQKNREELERRRITNLLANLSHEFKTPLGIISGFVEMIEDGIKVDNHKDYLKIINDELDILNNLVNESLELTKYESKLFILNESVFSISELIEKITYKFETDINQNNLSFNVNATDAYVVGDIKKIEQVLTNIISNAIKYSYKDEAISINCANDMDHVSISIDNVGDRLSDDNISKLWDAYFRVESSRNRKTGGSGLGLSIAKGILDLHDSKYAINNTENGVRFYFTLKIK